MIMEKDTAEMLDGFIKKCSYGEYTSSKVRFYSTHSYNRLDKFEKRLKSLCIQTTNITKTWDEEVRIRETLNFSALEKEVIDLPYGYHVIYSIPGIRHISKPSLLVNSRDLIEVNVDLLFLDNRIIRVIKDIAADIANEFINILTIFNKETTFLPFKALAVFIIDKLVEDSKDTAFWYNLLSYKESIFTIVSRVIRYTAANLGVVEERLVLEHEGYQFIYKNLMEVINEKIRGGQ